MNSSMLIKIKKIRFVVLSRAVWLCSLLRIASATWLTNEAVVLD
jgi:hypothetical protein